MKRIAIRFLAVSVAGVLAWSGVAAADSVDVDGDAVVTTSENFSISGTCPTAAVVKAGTVKIVYNNGGGGHYAANELLDISAVATDSTNNVVAGISSVTTASTPRVPSVWDTNGQQASFPISTSVAATVPNGVYTVTYTVAGASFTRTDSFTITRSCSAATVDTWELAFQRPVDGSSTSGGVVVNSVKNGRVVPVKVEISLNTVEQEAGNFTINVVKTTCPGSSASVDPVEAYADAGQSSAGTNAFRWSDEEGGHWIYNLDTKALGLTSNNCYRVDVYSGSVRISGDQWVILKAVK